MDDHFQNAGVLGENMARRYLMKEGFDIVSSNFRIRGGEIDLIACKKGELHFVEVKTRTTPAYGSPLEAVNGNKQRRMTKAAQVFLLKNAEWAKNPKCFSVISVDLSGENPQILFLPNAFESAGGYY